MFVEVTKDNLESVVPAGAVMGRANCIAALEAGYTVEFFHQHFLYRFSYNGQQHTFRHILFPYNSAAASEVARNKLYTSIVLQEAHIPSLVTKAYTKESSSQQLRSIAEEIGFPAVVKPTAAYMGKGVQTGIESFDQLEQSVQYLFGSGERTVVIEQYVPEMEDYRFFVFDGKVRAVLHRIKPYIIGDGKSTISELIEQKNAKRSQIKPLKIKPISTDDELERTLQQHGYTVESIPSEGEYVRLKNVCNMSVGGETATVEQFEQVVHPRNSEIAIAAANALGLRWAGIDMMCSDLSKPIDETGGIINEVNSKPDYAIHLYPMTGTPVQLAPLLINALFS